MSALDSSTRVPSAGCGWRLPRLFGWPRSPTPSTFSSSTRRSTGGSFVCTGTTSPPFMVGRRAQPGPIIPLSLVLLAAPAQASAHSRTPSISPQLPSWWVSHIPARSRGAGGWRASLAARARFYGPPSRQYRPLMARQKLQTQALLRCGKRLDDPAPDDTTSTRPWRLSGLPALSRYTNRW